MKRRRVDIESTSCPFIDLNDPRCDRHFTLSRIEDAFGLCLGNYHNCPTYHRLTVETRPLRITVSAKVAARSAPVRAAS